MQKQASSKDGNIQQQVAEIQRQASQIEEMEADIAKKSTQIMRCGQEITNQQTTINELRAKLPSVDLMQVKIYISLIMNISGYHQLLCTLLTCITRPVLFLGFLIQELIIYATYYQTLGQIILLACNTLP